MELGKYIMALEPISTAYFMNPSHQSVSICVYPIVARQRLSKNRAIVARQRLSKNVTATTNTHATIDELLDTSSSMRSVFYHGK
jgi:hypothetical protein